jgi:protein SCO1/2
MIFIGNDHLPHLQGRLRPFPAQPVFGPAFTPGWAYPAIIPSAPFTGLLLALAMALLAQPVTAQTNEPPPPGFEGATVVEKPNAQVPLDIEFLDEDGRTVRLADFFKPDRPVLLVPVYFQCPMLCNLTLNGLVKAVRPLRLTPGKDFQLITVSFDPREGPELAKAKKANYLHALGKPEAAPGWHFLTSSRPERARRLCDTIGFGYKLDPKGENYLHQAAIYICTPAGRVARTIQGVEFDPEMLRDSLIDASAGKISSGLFGVALSCGLFHFDPATGKYTPAAMAIMRVTGILTMIVLGAVIGTMIYRESRKKATLQKEQ